MRCGLGERHNRPAERTREPNRANHDQHDNDHDQHQRHAALARDLCHQAIHFGGRRRRKGIDQLVLLAAQRRVGGGIILHCRHPIATDQIHELVLGGVQLLVIEFTHGLQRAQQIEVALQVGAGLRDHLGQVFIGRELALALGIAVRDEHAPHGVAHLQHVVANAAHSAEHPFAPLDRRGLVMIGAVEIRGGPQQQREDDTDQGKEALGYGPGFHRRR